MSQYQVLLQAVGPAEAQGAVCRAADEWGADFELLGAGGNLRLPVLQGLQRGLISGAVAIEAEGDGSRVVLIPAASEYAVNTPAFCLVLVAAIGAVLTVLWPLYPRLLPFAPLGAVLAIAGWFQVSRQQKRGPEDFMRRVEAHAAGPLDGALLLGAPDGGSGDRGDGGGEGGEGMGGGNS
jgi:hypothetical protein